MLTDAAIRKAKPAEKAVRMADSGGLYLEVSPAGSKLWRYKYRFDGKEKRLALGVYPQVGLADARAARDRAKEDLRRGLDPAVLRKALGPSAADRDTFGEIATEWLEKFRTQWVEAHAFRVELRLNKNILPWLGALPIQEVTPRMVLGVVRRCEERGAIETAHRVLQDCSKIFRYAVATDRAERDITADLRGAIPPAQVRHMAATLEPVALGGILRQLWGYKGTPMVSTALKLAPMLFVRPGELRTMQWEDIDLDKAEWRYLITKTQTPHIVPLPTQAVAILKEIQPLTGRGVYVHPSPRRGDDERPLSDNGVLAAMRRMGIENEELTGHGFRAIARTLLDEVLGFRPDYIEHQLGHAVRDPNGRAYNRTAYLEERRKMMQAWADYLDGLRTGKPTPQPKKKAKAQT